MVVAFKFNTVTFEIFNIKKYEKQGEAGICSYYLTTLVPFNIL